MESSPTIISIGAVCFGVVVGFITYRTLVFKEGASVSDIAAVIAAVGGGAIAVWFDRAGGDSFAWYSMGLLGGVILYYAHTSIRGPRELKEKLNGTPHGSGIDRELKGELHGAPHGSGIERE